MTSNTPPPQLSPNLDSQVVAVFEPPLNDIEAVASHFKKGYKTSEAWLTAATIGLVAADGFWDLGLDLQGIVGMASVVVSYVVGRSWLKSKRTEAVAAENTTGMQVSAYSN